MSSVADAPAWLDGELMARVLGVPRVASCSVVPAAGKGDNYASVVYKCVVRVDEGDERRVIVKCLPANALRQMFCNKAQIFRKERDMYTRILPRYESMLSAVQPGRTSFPWPEHYASEVDGKQDFVALKDLGPQGFSMAQRMTGLDEDHLSLVLSAFGEFHACSAAHRVLTPTEAFQAEVVVPFQEFMYSEDVQDMATWVEKSVEMTAGIVEAWGGSYEAVGRWIARWARGAHAQMRDLLTVERPGTLLCHGDAWINNMLFRHHRSSEGQEAKPAEVKLLDFQIARYSSPVTDLLYLMVTSTTSAIRKQHWDRLLEREYLGSFWRTLELLGVKESFGSNIYSMDWIRSEMKRLAPWVLLNAMTVLRAVVLEVEDAPDLDQLTEEDLKMERDVFKGTDDRVYQERLRDLIDELSEIGLFIE